MTLEPVKAAGSPPSRRRAYLNVAVNLIGPVAFAGIYAATGQVLDATWGLLAGSLLSLALGWFVARRVAPLPLVLGLLSILSGGFTLVFHSAGFLKLEVTVHSMAVALALFGSSVLGINVLKVLAGQLVHLPDDCWRTLGLRLALLEVAVAVGNLVVWQTQPDAVWAAFKFPGLLLIHLLFLATQWPLVRAARRQAVAG